MKRSRRRPRQWYPRSKVCLQIKLILIYFLYISLVFWSGIRMKPEQSKGAIATSSTINASSQQDVSRTFRHGRETVEFSVKGPIGISINDEQLTNSGCAALDLIFTSPSKVGEITFRNYYTMWLSVLVKMKLSPNSEEPGFLPNPTYEKDENPVSEWIKSVPKKVIMSNPHYENGSQDIVSIPASESLVEWKNLVAMRLILRQPSPVWKTFHVEEINVYKDLPRRAPNKETAAESLMLLIKRQTIAALKWTPNPDGTTQSSGGYEFCNLPQP